MKGWQAFASGVIHRQTRSIIKIVRLFGARFEHNKSDEQGNKRGHARHCFNQNWNWPVYPFNEKVTFSGKVIKAPKCYFKSMLSTSFYFIFYSFWCFSERETMDAIVLTMRPWTLTSLNDCADKPTFAVWNICYISTISLSISAK